MINSAQSKGIKELLKAKKFRVEDPLSEQLIKSLTTKTFYTLAHYKLLEKLADNLKIGEEITIVPYRSIIGDIRYLIKFHGLRNEDVVVQWNGKFNQNGKAKHSMFFINVENFNVTECLDAFVEFEQKVVASLHAIENDFFQTVPVNLNRVDESPVMHSHVDEE